MHQRFGWHFCLERRHNFQMNAWWQITQNFFFILFENVFNVRRNSVFSSNYQVAFVSNNFHFILLKPFKWIAGVCLHFFNYVHIRATVVWQNCKITVGTIINHITDKDVKKLIEILEELEIQFQKKYCKYHYLEFFFVYWKDNFGLIVMIPSR